MCYILYIIGILFLIKVIFVFCSILVTYLWMHRKQKKRKKKLDNSSKGIELILEQADTGRGFLRKNIVYIIEGMIKYFSEWCSKIPSHLLRNQIYKKIFLIDLKKGAVIYKGVIFRYGCYITIGEYSVIGDDSILDGRGGLTIGKNCNISSDVRIWTAQHAINGKNFDYEEKNVIIGDYCWVSSNVTILPGVTIGDGAVIASGAVLTKNAEAYGIYAGIPAKKIGQRDFVTPQFQGEHNFFY